MPLRIWRILTLLGRPPGLAGGINGSRMAHSASERSLAYGFMGEFLTFHFFCLDLLLLYHISPSRLLLFKRLPWPFRTAVKQEARLPTNLVPRACVRHSLLPCEQGKRKKTCPRPDRSLGHDRGTDRNRRDSNSLSPVLIHFLAPHGKLYQRLLRKQDSGLVPSLTSSLCRICMCREMTELVRCALLVPSTQNKHSRGGRYDNG